MIHKAALPLSIAALSLAIMLPANAQSGDMSGGNTQNSGSMSQPRGHHEAMRMVPARAVLDRDLDADKTKDGYEFNAKLAKKVQLDNGPELPEGTILVGKVVKDDMNESGASKLALRFTEARLKDGQVVPIKATIVGVFKDNGDDPNGYPVSPGDEVPNSWNDGTLQVDQISVMSGVDLHSKIASKNSGVFVSPTKHNMTIPAESELALAIAARHHGMKGMKGMSGMHCN
ncbi:MAG: hypothetical protein HIU91_14725 [Acidobacteria bacterium]|nr:hypothetical protein [Acidobacteriota bacterium]